MKTCPNCGEQIDAFATRCSCCQADLRNAPATERSDSAKRSPRGTFLDSFRLVLSAFGILLLVWLAIAFLFPQPGHGPVSVRNPCKYNLKQIGLALHNYHDAYGSFPPAYVADENGRPLYSWRVLILPWMDEVPLYNQFDLTQPWDSPTNRKVLEQMPKMFTCPTDSNAKPNTTSYVAVFGPNCVFSGTTPTTIRDVTDGTSNTLMVGEVTGTAIPWTKPEDIDITAQPTIGIPGGFSSRHEGGCFFLLADGAVCFLHENIPFQTLHNLFLRNDGHAVGDSGR